MKKRMRRSNHFRTVYFRENKNYSEAMDNKKMKIIVFNTKMNMCIALSNSKIYYLKLKILLPIRKTLRSQILTFSQMYN